MAAPIIFLEGDFFGEGEVVGCCVFPVDQVDGFVGLVDGDFYFCAVAEELVDGEVGGVEVASGGVGGGGELLEGGADVGGGVAACGEVGAEEVGFDVAVVGSLCCQLPR